MLVVDIRGILVVLVNYLHHKGHESVHEDLVALLVVAPEFE